MDTNIKDIDTYISTFPIEVQALLQQVRATIRKAAPEAVEAIKYGMPTFVMNGNLIHFAGYKNHIGLYPLPSGIETFKEEIAAYHHGKGSIQFPLDQALPLELISKMVKFRVEQNLEKAAKKKK